MGMREEFEIAIPDSRFLWNDERNEYWPAPNSGLGDGSLSACMQRDRELMVWQASRAALCVELPKRFDCELSECKDGEFLYFNETIKAIESAGVKCK